MSELAVDVDGLSFKIRRGEIYGLLGPNGAGKSSTLKVLAGILEPSYGKIKIFGKPVSEEVEVKRLIGYVIALTVVTLYLRRELVSAIAFGLVQAVSVAAGCMMELLLLVRKFWDVEISSSNIYANLPAFILCAYPWNNPLFNTLGLCFIVGFSNIFICPSHFPCMCNHRI